MSTLGFYDTLGFIPYFVENVCRRVLGVVEWNRILFDSRIQLLSGKQKLDIELVSVPIETQLWGIVLMDRVGFDGLGRFWVLMDWVILLKR